MKTAAKEPQKTSGRGGKRQGAGRPAVSAEGKTRFVGATIPAAMVEQLDARCQAEGRTRSQALTDALRKWLARRK